MTTITAKSILRSRNVEGGREPVLSTLLLHYPRFIHAEFMTHRVMSRNAASSRAIPFEKQLEAMLADPAIPLHWGANQKGMQADEQIEDTAMAEQVWRNGLAAAVIAAQTLHELGLHKQVVNRIIEPYTHIKVLVSATEWDNFLDLRCHHAAEPHMRMLAEAIKHELDTAPIQELSEGEWHMPFVDCKTGDPDEIAVSVARCASTSYKTVDNFDMSLDRARPLHDQFVFSRPQHASPLEHVAQADGYGRDFPGDRRWKNPEQHANFVGFKQYRHLV